MSKFNPCVLTSGFTLSLLVLLCLPLSNAVQATSIESSSKNGPVILELFTSEGCSSCPPADTLLSELIKENGTKIAPLSEHVSYWNYIGWTDPNSSKLFDNRQYRYVKRLGLNSSYTPQIVVDGIDQAAGNDRSSVTEAIARALKKPPLLLPLSTSIKSGKTLTVKIDNAILKDKSGELILFITESGITSKVRAGENDGRILKHDAVVRAFKTKPLTPTKHEPIGIDIDVKSAWNMSKLNLIAFIQQPDSGKILFSRIIPSSKWNTDDAR